MEILLKKLGLNKEEVIGVGDSDNDLPIFDSVGYKVAMAKIHVTDTVAKTRRYRSGK